MSVYSTHVLGAVSSLEARLTTRYAMRRDPTRSELAQTNYFNGLAWILLTFDLLGRYFSSEYERFADGITLLLSYDALQITAVFTLLTILINL
jgi:hypothetical protein